VNAFEINAVGSDISSQRCMDSATSANSSDSLVSNNTATLSSSYSSITTRTATPTLNEQTIAKIMEQIRYTRSFHKITGDNIKLLFEAP